MRRCVIARGTDHSVVYGEAEIVECAREDYLMWYPVSSVHEAPCLLSVRVPFLWHALPAALWGVGGQGQG